MQEKLSVGLAHTYDFSWEFTIARVHHVSSTKQWEPLWFCFTQVLSFKLKGVTYFLKVFCGNLVWQWWPINNQRDKESHFLISGRSTRLTCLLCTQEIQWKITQDKISTSNSPFSAFTARLTSPGLTSTLIGYNCTTSGGGRGYADYLQNLGLLKH